MIKATQEIFDALKSTREEVITKIKDKTLKGEIRDSAIYIDESELPENLQPKTDIIEKIVKEKPVETASKKQPDSLELLKAETQKIEADTKKIKAEIEYAVMKGERDKPEILKKREENLNQREAGIVAQETIITDKTNQLVLREKMTEEKEKTLLDRLNNTDKLCQEKLEVTKKEISSQLTTFNKNIEAKQLDLLNIEEEIKLATVKLDGLLDVIGEYNNSVEPLRVDVKRLLGYTFNGASNYTNLGRKTNGKTSDIYIQKANRLWNISDILKRLLNSLKI